MVRVSGSGHRGAPGLRGQSGAACFTAIPPSDSFLGALIEQVERTTDPREASLFLIPAVLDVAFLGPHGAEFEGLLARFLHGFPWFPRCPDRHVVFLLGDNWVVPAACREAAVFMPSCARASGALPLCYFAGPPATAVVPIGEAEYEVSFQGAITTGRGVRARLAASLRACRTRPVRCRVTDGYFHLTYGPEEQRALRAGYLELMTRSRFVFCPRGDGLSSLRFFEALAHGRLPLLVGDETALPLATEIPYDDFVVRVPEANVEDWEAYLDAFLASHRDLEYCSSLARNAHDFWFTVPSLARLVERSLEVRAGWPAGSSAAAVQRPWFHQ